MNPYGIMTKSVKLFQNAVLTSECSVLPLADHDQVSPPHPDSSRRAVIIRLSIPAHTGVSSMDLGSKIIPRNTPTCLPPGYLAPLRSIPDRRMDMMGETPTDQVRVIHAPFYSE